MKTPQAPPIAGMSPLGANMQTFKSDDGSTRCVRCHLHPDQCTCDPSYPLWRILGLQPRKTDEKTVAERKWQAPLKPRAEQKACDAGLFDDSKQTELF